VTLGHPAPVGSAIVPMFVNFAPAGNCFHGFLAKVDFKPAESAGALGEFNPLALLPCATINESNGVLKPR
jgi:hypothetical protein